MGVEGKDKVKAKAVWGIFLTFKRLIKIRPLLLPFTLSFSFSALLAFPSYLRTLRSLEFLRSIAHFLGLVPLLRVLRVRGLLMVISSEAPP